MVEPKLDGFLDRVAGWFGARAKPVSPPTVERPHAEALTAEDPRLPDATRPRVERLLALIADIEGRAADDTMLASALGEVRQMRDVHLPRLVASYAEIPAEHRAEIFRRTGRSASYNLNQGFDRMIVRLETLSRSLAEGNLDSFADNLRFIEHRYGEDDPLR